MELRYKKYECVALHIDLSSTSKSSADTPNTSATRGKNVSGAL